ncbi:MAG: hypothetical protein MJE77_23920 [Proteobacteria bacterium]|nr:hypothetical protein [Pseudomonadota bacterium]
MKLSHQLIIRICMDRSVWRSRLWPVALAVGLAAGVLVGPVRPGRAQSAQTPGTKTAQVVKRRPHVRITPNAVQDPETIMDIEIDGEFSQTVYLFVLRNCDGNRRSPELSRQQSSCKPLWQKTVKLDDRGRGFESIRMKDLTSAEGNVRLWLRAAAVPDGRRHYTDAVFALRRQGCGVLATMLRRDCEWGTQLLIPRRGAEKLPRMPFQVVRQGLRGSIEAIPVPGTRGATGVAWESQRSLIVTIRGPGKELKPGFTISTEAAREQLPGLYRVNVLTGRRTRLLAAPGTQVAALAIEDVASNHGWELFLVEMDKDRAGKLKVTREVATRVGEDLLPAWRPDGVELAWVSEVKP